MIIDTHHKHIIELLEKLEKQVTVGDFIDDMKNMYPCYCAGDILHGLYDIISSGTYPFKILIHPIHDTIVLTLVICPNAIVAVKVSQMEGRVECSLPDLNNGIMCYLNEQPEPQAESMWQSFIDVINADGYAEVGQVYPDMTSEQMIDFLLFLRENIERWSFFIPYDQTIIDHTLVVGYSHNFSAMMYEELTRTQILKIIKDQISDLQAVKPTPSIGDGSIVSLVDDLQAQLSHAFTEMWGLSQRLSPVMNGGIEYPAGDDTIIEGSQLRYDLNVCTARVAMLRNLINQMNNLLDM